MDAREETAEEPILFPTAVSEEQLEEAKRESTLKRLYASSQIFLAPGEKRPQRPDLQGRLIIQNQASEHYMNGKEAMEKCQYEKAVICFSKGINLQPEETQLYVSLAEAYLQLCDFQSAAACFKRACVREPRSFSDRLAFVYYLQGQCLFDRGLFLDALEAFTKAAEVKPSCRTSAVRSLACLTAAGHLTDCLQVLNEWIASDGPTSDLYVLRARLYKQMNQNSQCYYDVKSALLLKPTCPEAEALLLQLREAGERARRTAVDRALTGQMAQALCMINIALENCPRDGHLYLFRGILYRRLKDFSAAIEDLVQAAELSDDEVQTVKCQAEAREEGDSRGSLQKEAEFQLVLTYNDLAVQCFGRGLYAEATLLLNKAIKEEKGQAGLYLNRGDCFFKQREWSYALADYQQAEEMLPDEPAVQLRLGVVHDTLGSLYFEEGRFHDAAAMFSAAVRHNPTASRYYENRSKAFRKVLNWEGAQQDFICTLILDPTNEELHPMLMSVFPGSSVSDVLSSPAAQTVRVQLTEAVQAFSSRFDQQRLSEKLQRMTLSPSTANLSQDSSEAGERLKLCVNQQELQMSLKSFVQVKESLSFLHEPCTTLTPASVQHPPPASTRRSTRRDPQERRTHCNIWDWRPRIRRRLEPYKERSLDYV